MSIEGALSLSAPFSGQASKRPTTERQEKKKKTMASKKAPAATAPAATAPVAADAPIKPVKREYAFKVVPLSLLNWSPDREMSRDGQTIEELSVNIRDNGLDKAIDVKPNGKRFDVVDGRRRCTACEMVGVKHVPINIVEESVDSKAAAFRSNYMRLDLAPLEKVEQICAMKADGKDTARISKESGASTVTVNNLLRIGTKLTDGAKKFAKENKVGMGGLLKAAGFDTEIDQIAAMKKKEKTPAAPAATADTSSTGEGGDKEVDYAAIKKAVEDRTLAAVPGVNEETRARLLSFLDMLTPRQQPHFAGLLEHLFNTGDQSGDATEPQVTEVEASAVNLRDLA